MKKHKTKEYREYVAKLVVEEGRIARDLAHELEIPYSTLLKWVAAYKEDKATGGKDSKYVTPSELKKIEDAYHKKLRELEEENEILKKAMHIFTKNQM